jgi:hypothetical protein
MGQQCLGFDTIMTTVPLSAVVSPGLDTLSATSFLSRGRYSTTIKLQAVAPAYSFSTGA